MKFSIGSISAIQILKTSHAQAFSMTIADISLCDAELIYSDKNLLVFNKKHGITVIPGRDKNDSLCLRNQIENVTGEKLFVVHRIDRDTSGIVVFAKNRETHRLLCRQFEERLVKKEYLAVVAGKTEAKGVLQKPIYQFGSGRMGVDKRGKESVTEFIMVESFENASVLKVFPHTGRRHQIRVHLFDEGHPILGDPLYGRNRPVGGIPRLMLHASRITFTDPDRKTVTFAANVDKEWDRLISVI